MSRSMTLNVRVGGTLGEFVASRVGGDGSYENVSEYVRDLIRRDQARAEDEAFARLKAELGQSFAAPESSYREVDAEAVIANGKRRAAG